MGIILICENSLEGVFSGIYEAYERRLPHEDTKLQLNWEYETLLFWEGVLVETSEEHFVKVRRTLLQRLGEEVYEWICMALAQEKTGMADAAYHTIVKALGKGPNTGRYVLQDLADPNVNRVYMAGQRSAREIDHLRGFLRFEERGTEEKILYTQFAPEGNVISFLAPHFADRLPCENFILHDVKRGLFVVHPKEHPWYVLADRGERLHLPECSPEEEAYRKLFQTFCHCVAIKQRQNSGLQLQMLPLRYREFMVEF